MDVKNELFLCNKIELLWSFPDNLTEKLFNKFKQSFPLLVNFRNHLHCLYLILLYIKIMRYFLDSYTGRSGHGTEAPHPTWEDRRKRRPINDSSLPAWTPHTAQLLCSGHPVPTAQSGESQLPRDDSGPRSLCQQQKGRTPEVPGVSPGPTLLVKRDPGKCCVTCEMGPSIAQTALGACILP